MKNKSINPSSSCSENKDKDPEDFFSRIRISSAISQQWKAMFCNAKQQAAISLQYKIMSSNSEQLNAISSNGSQQRVAIKSNSVFQQKAIPLQQGAILLQQIAIHLLLQQYDAIIQHYRQYFAIFQQFMDPNDTAEFHISLDSIELFVVTLSNFDLLTFFQTNQYDQRRRTKSWVVTTSLNPLPINSTVKKLQGKEVLYEQ